MAGPCRPGACYRLVDLYGMSDMMANHISVRTPGEEAFLINRASQ